MSVELRMDAEAVAAVPDLERRLRADDLREAGWEIKDLEKEDNGETLLTAEHRFASPSEANAVLAQLGGPFRQLTLDRKRSLARSTYTFSGSVDLTRGLDSFGDVELANRLGSPLGFDTGEMQAALDLDPQTAFPVDVRVDLPGRIQEQMPTPGEDDAWRLQYGSITELSASSSATGLQPLSYFGLAVLFAIAAIVVSRLWNSGRYRPQHRRTGSGMRARDLLAQADVAREKTAHTENNEDAENFERKVVLRADGAARAGDVIAFTREQHGASLSGEPDHAAGDPGHPTGGDGWCVLLIERGGGPFAGHLALPGGFLEKSDGSPGKGAMRELVEETGLRVDPPINGEDEQRPQSLHLNRLMWLGLYDKPGRDPRRPTATDAYVAILESDVTVMAADDAAAATWIPLDHVLLRYSTLPEGSRVLAFDQDDMLRDAVELIRQLGVLPAP